jgi:hypothetical protein
MNEVIISFFIIIYGLLSMIFTTGLFAYHTNLISSNMTTKEELKHAFRTTQGNPFVRSCGNNCKQALCPTVSNPPLLKRLRKNEKIFKERMRMVKSFLFIILVY